MPFRAPSGNVGSTTRDRYSRIMQLAEDDAEGRALPRGGASRVDTSLLDDQERQDSERQRLLMTPGVRRGGSTATRPQANSPLNVGSSQRFERFGEAYSYDPWAAADQVGSTEATKEASADRTRYEAMRKVPGITERMAKQLVYGRGDVIDSDESRAALAEFVRRPSRDTAAGAIERGANPNSAPFYGGFDTATGTRAPALRRGDEGYLDAMRDEEMIREARAKRMAELNASLRPERRDRETKVTGPNGEIGILNFDADGNEKPVTWTGATGAKPGGSSRGAGAGAAYMQPSGASGPATPPAAKAPVNPEEAAAGFVNVKARATTPQSEEADRSRFAARLQALKTAGRTRDEAAAIMTREGWDPMTGLRKR